MEERGNHRRTVEVEVLIEDVTPAQADEFMEVWRGNANGEINAVLPDGLYVGEIVRVGDA